MHMTHVRVQDMHTMNACDASFRFGVHASHVTHVTHDDHVTRRSSHGCGTIKKQYQSKSLVLTHVSMYNFLRVVCLSMWWVCYVDLSVIWCETHTTARVSFVHACIGGCLGIV